MITEFFDSLCVTTAHRAARRLGYAREAAALEARHRRCSDAWSGHICATQNALLASADRAADSAGLAVIIGGGVVHDLSLSDLLACFAEVMLVDIAFTRQTRRAIGPYGDRIRCQLADITGVVDGLCVAPKELRNASIAQRWPFPLPEHTAWIASVNCLTQLPLLPAAWLLRHSADGSMVESFGQALIMTHLSQLATSGVPVCLISEMADRRIGPRRKVLDQTDYRPLLEPKLNELGARETAQWEWLVHPTGELAKGESEIRQVSAWEFGERDSPRGASL